MRREEIIVTRWLSDRVPALLTDDLIVVTSQQYQDDFTPDSGARLLIVDAGPACAPDHPAIAIAVRLLARHWRGGGLLDIGSGSAVLVMAAALLKPELAAQIELIETDASIVDYLRETIEINGLTGININCQALQSLADLSQRNCALIHTNLLSLNLSSDFATGKLLSLIALLKRLKAALADDGEMILTGIKPEPQITIKSCWGWRDRLWITIDRDLLMVALAATDLEIIDSEIADHWQAVVVKNCQQRDKN